MKTAQKTVVARETLVASLLTAWEADGYFVGTDTYLELNNLLNRIPQDHDVAQLKTLIAPVLTSNAEQQNAFYNLFDTILNQAIQSQTEHAEAIKIEQNRYYQRRVKHQVLSGFQQIKHSFRHNLIKSVAISVLILAALACLGKLYLSRNQYDAVKSSSKIGELTSVCFNLKTGDEVKKITQTTGVVQMLSARNYTNRFCMTYQPSAMGKDTILCQVVSKNGRSEVVAICINSAFAWGLAQNPPAQQKIDTKMAPSVSIQKKEDSMDLTNLNFLQDSSKTEEMNGKYVENYSSSWEFGFGNAYFSTEKALIVLASLGLVLLLAAYYRFKNQKFTLVQDTNKEDLYNWTIKIPASEQINMDADYYIALSEMRQRESDESPRLDINKTVRSTIDNAGLIDFKYKTQFLSKNYIVFIEKNNPLSSQTKLYALIADSLLQNEVPMQVFFFSSETYLCWNETHKNAVPIKDIQHKNSDAQIIIFSDGYNFIRPYLPAVYVFSAWRKRVLLTPVPVAEWGEAEDNLAKTFRLLPASTYGLSQVVETLEAVEVKSHHVLKNDFLKKSKHAIVPTHVTPDFLQILNSQFVITKAGQKNDALLRWLAACAIPPVLFWDWTLLVGDKLSAPYEHFLNIENLSLLCNLQWFKDGKMPEDVRGFLIEWLKKEHPVFYLSILQEWSAVLRLEENLPPRGSLDWYGHRIQLILAELSQNPKKREQRRLEIELDNLLAGDMVKDAMVVQYINNRTEPVESVLSDRFRKFIQVRKNVFWRWRDWTWQTPSVCAVFLATLLVSYTEPVTTFNFGENITALAFSPDSKGFLSASGNGNVSICDIQTQTMQGVKTKNNVIHVETGSNPKNWTIYAASTEGNIMEWQQTKHAISSVSAEGGIKAIAVLPNTQKVLVGYYSDNSAKLFDLSESGRSTAVFTHTDAITDVCFSKNGANILTASRDNTAKLWSPNGTLLQTFRHKDIVHSVDISPDGTKILTGSRDNTAKLWSRDGILLQTLEGHDYDVFDVHFSPNGAMLLTASGDKTAKLWSLDGRLLRTLRGHLNYINAATFSPDNTKAITGDSEGKVKIWTLVK
jgi:hypothetical protein